MKIIFLLTLTYLFCILLIFVFQRKIIYFPQVLTLDQQIELAASQELKLWPNEKQYLGLVSKTERLESKGTIIVFHGNAGSAINRSYYINALENLGYRVILAEYLGYGAKPGKPTEITLLEEADKIVTQAVNDFGLPLFLMGESLGSGVVSGLIKSTNHSITGIALIMPFDSLANVAHHHYWFFLAKWLVQDRFNNMTALQNYHGNSAVIMAAKDQIIPNQHTLKLFHTLPDPKKLWTFPSAGHNTLPLAPNEPWWKEVMSFIAEQDNLQ